VLARIQFPGRNLLSGYFVAGMGLPYQLILIPYYVLMAGFGLTNSLLGLVVTYIVLQFPFSTLLLMSFFRTLPSELEDQAAIDGTSEFGIFWRIMFPLASPGIITTIIFNFVWIWKEFLMAQTLIQDDAYRTLPVGLLNINHSMRYTGDWASLFAAVVIIIVPIFVAYFFISRRVMSGLTLGVSK
jgi:ABC-type glycerol-3-phosphate transport system permease component